MLGGGDGPGGSNERRECWLGVQVLCAYCVAVGRLLGCGYCVALCKRLALDVQVAISHLALDVQVTGVGYSGGKHRV